MVVLINWTIFPACLGSHKINVSNMVLILDGNMLRTEGKNIGLLRRKRIRCVTTLDLIKCLNKSNNRESSLHAYFWVII